jgi:N-acetylmuramoyl-L-alanine amidase
MLRFLFGSVLITVCSVFVSSAQQESSRVIIEGSAATPALIATFTEQSVVYGSMRDVASSLNLGFYRNTETGKIELKTDRFRLKATPDNPFVIVTDVFSNAQSIYQLPVNVIATGNDLFVPMQYFAKFLDIVLPTGVEFTHTDRTLAVAKPDLYTGPDITAMEVEERANGYLIRLRSRRPIKDYSGFYREDGWFYLTIVGARIDTGVFTRFRPVTPVRKIVPVLSPTSFQLSLQLSTDIHSTDIFRDPQSNDLIIALHKKTDPASIVQRHTQNGPVDNLSRERDRWKLDVIVIDAGHGGKDPGTIGVRGTKEKDVTLGISLKLGEMIEQRMPETKVVYTRKTDEFVELFRRGQIANEAGGKLFVSVHANSTRRKPAPQRGFEIYLLRPGRTEEAIRIAERENSVIRFEDDHEERYAHLSDENFILVTMAHSAYIRYSEQFADILQQKMAKTTRVPNRGVRQAGFYVLVGASMPSVLVEAGYLSNADEERYLAGTQGQQHVAEAIYNAIELYSTEYETIFQTASGN